MHVAQTGSPLSRRMEAPAQPEAARVARRQAGWQDPLVTHWGGSSFRSVVTIDFSSSASASCTRCSTNPTPGSCSRNWRSSRTSRWSARACYFSTRSRPVRGHSRRSGISTNSCRHCTSSRPARSLTSRSATSLTPCPWAAWSTCSFTRSRSVSSSEPSKAKGWLMCSRDTTSATPSAAPSPAPPRGRHAPLPVCRGHAGGCAGVRRPRATSRRPAHPVVDCGHDGGRLREVRVARAAGSAPHGSPPRGPQRGAEDQVRERGRRAQGGRGARRARPACQGPRRASRASLVGQRRAAWRGGQRQAVQGHFPRLRPRQPCLRAAAAGGRRLDDGQRGRSGRAVRRPGVARLGPPLRGCAALLLASRAKCQCRGGLRHRRGWRGSSRRGEGGRRWCVAVRLPVSEREGPGAGYSALPRAAGEESLPLPGDLSRTVRLLSLPLYLAGQVRRLAAEWRDAPPSPTLS